MTIIVLDGQGGGIGRAIIAALSPLLPQGAQLLCVGTNAMATAAMLKAGAQRGATGENAVCWAARNADILIAPIALVLKGFHDGRNHRKHGCRRRFQPRHAHPRADRALRHARRRGARGQHAVAGGRCRQTSGGARRPGVSFGSFA